MTIPRNLLFLAESSIAFGLIQDELKVLPG
jgi:hypothetical protein